MGVFRIPTQGASVDGTSHKHFSEAEVVNRGRTTSYNYDESRTVFQRQPCCSSQRWTSLLERPVWYFRIPYTANPLIEKLSQNTGVLLHSGYSTPGYLESLSFQCLHV